MIGLGIQRGAALTYDSDSRAFFSRALVSDPVVMRRHDTIVRFLKGQVLWSSNYLWYGADAGAMHDILPLAPASDGETVRRWINRRGDYLHADQTTGPSQPLFDSNGGPNGLPCIASDGVDDGFNIATVNRWRFPLTICAFGTTMASGGTDNRYIIGPGASSGASGSDLLMLSSLAGTGQKQLFTYTGAALKDSVNFSYTPSGDKLLSHVFNGANCHVWCTGETDVSGSLITNLGTANCGIGPSLLLFRSTNGNYNKGNFSHIFAFGAALTKSQHSALETLLFSL